MSGKNIDLSGFDEVVRNPSKAIDVSAFDEKDPSKETNLIEYKPSALETGLAAMAPKGLTSAVYGLKEAVPVALDKGFDAGLDVYRRERDQARKDLSSSESLNPRAALVGSTAPYVVGGVLPGGAALGEIPVMMGMGGAQAAMDSKADLTRLNNPEQIKRLASDVGTGMGTAGALGALGNYAPKTTTAIAGGALAGELVSPGKGALPGAAVGLAVRGAASPAVRQYLLKKFGNVALDVPEQVSERYMKNPSKVMNAEPVEGVAQNIADTFSDVRSDIGPLNNKAVSSLSTDRNSGVMKVNDAVEILNKFNHPEAKQMTEEIMNGYAKRAGDLSQGAAAENLTDFETHRLKKLLQDLGDFRSLLMSSDKAEANIASGKVNDLLRGANPEYAQLMDETSKRIRLKDALAKKFGIQRDLLDPNKVTFSDRTVTAIKDLVRANKFDRKELLGALNELGYGDLANQVEDSLAKQLLTGQGVPNGSRKAKMFGAAGGSAGSAIGAMIGGWPGAMVGSAVGGGAGAMTGGAMDKYGPRVARRLMDLNNGINNLGERIGSTLPGLPEGVQAEAPYLLNQIKEQPVRPRMNEVADRDRESRRPQSMNYSPQDTIAKLQNNPETQKYVPVLQNAIQRGQESFGAIYFSLFSNEPAFRKAIQGDNQ